MSFNDFNSKTIVCKMSLSLRDQLYKIPITQQKLARIVPMYVDTNLDSVLTFPILRDSLVAITTHGRLDLPTDTND